MSGYKDGQNLCSSSFIKDWSHIINFYSYVFSIIWTWLWLMQVWCWKVFLCKLVWGCMSGINWKAPPVMKHVTSWELGSELLLKSISKFTVVLHSSESQWFLWVRSCAKFWVSLFPESVELSRLHEHETPAWISSRARGLNPGKVSHVFTEEECWMLWEFAAVLTHP